MTERWVCALPFYWIADKDRREVTRRIFRHYQRVRDELGVRITGVGSEGALSRDFWCAFFDEVDYREYPQNFQANHGGGDGLREKFNETVRAVRHLEPERVFIGGSDDLIPLEWYKAAFTSDADLVGVTGGAMIVEYHRGFPMRGHVWDGQYRHASDVSFCGGGLVIGARWLESLRWAPFVRAGDEVGIEREAREAGLSVEGFPGPFYAVKCRRVLNAAQVAGRHGARLAEPAEFGAFLKVWDGLK